MEEATAAGYHGEEASNEVRGGQEVQKKKGGERGGEEDTRIPVCFSRSISFLSLFSFYFSLPSPSSMVGCRLVHVSNLVAFLLSVSGGFSSKFSPFECLSLLFFAVPPSPLYPSVCLMNRSFRSNALLPGVTQIRLSDGLEMAI